MLKKTIIKTVSSHLTLLVLLPCFLLFGIVIYDVNDAFDKKINAQQSGANVELSHAILTLVHQVQKERGMTAGFIGSNGNKFASELISQRQQVDQALAALRQSSQQISLSEQMSRQLSQFLAEFSDLTQVRARVDGMQIALPQALRFYTGINEFGLHTVMSASKLSVNDMITKQLSALYNFSSVKESAGIERAVLANVIAADVFNTALRTKHTELLTKQAVYLDEALTIAPASVKTIFEQVATSSIIDEVQMYRDNVASKEQNFGLDASSWFATATKRIDLLKEAEERVLAKSTETANEIIDQTNLLLVIELLVLLVGIITTVAVYTAIRIRQRQSAKIGEGIRIAIDESNLGHEIDIVSADDLGVAAQDINALTRKFEMDLIEFSENSKRITASTHETTVAIEQNQHNLLQQKKGVETIAAATESMTVNVKDIAQAMNENSQSVTSVAEETRHGKQVVTDAVDVIKAAASDMEQSAATVAQLNDGVAGITSMVDMIKSIAEQTNLLALNAAIEAARAGEQGRGFAVVADEVRSLASRTQQSTEDIASLIEKLQRDSQQAFSVIEHGRNNAIEASTQAEAIQQTLDRIVEQIDTIKAGSDTVSQSTMQQSEVIEEVNHSVNNIYTQATENVAGSEQIAMAASHIAESANDMDSSIDKYKFATA